MTPPRATGQSKQPGDGSGQRVPAGTTQAAAQRPAAAANAPARAAGTGGAARADVYHLLRAGPEVLQLGLVLFVELPGRVFAKRILPGSWADQVELAVGDEILSLNGMSMFSMTTNILKACMGNRPLAMLVLPLSRRKMVAQAATKIQARVRGMMARLRMEVAESVHVDEDGRGRLVIAGVDVAHTGIVLGGRPPDQVLRVKRTMPGSWAEAAGILPGDQVLALNGTMPSAVTSVQELMAQRPLRIHLMSTATPVSAATEEEAAKRIQDAARGVGRVAASLPASPSSEHTDEFRWDPGGVSLETLSVQAFSPQVVPRLLGKGEAAVMIQACWRRRVVLLALEEMALAPACLVLADFHRKPVNGRYWKRHGWYARINGMMSYMHETYTLILYYCKACDDWRVTNTLEHAEQNLGLARSPRHMPVTEVHHLGVPWQEFDKDLSKWSSRGHPAVVEVDHHCHASFLLRFVSFEALAADPLLLGRLEAVFMKVVAALMGPGISPSVVRVMCADARADGRLGLHSLQRSPHEDEDLQVDLFAEAPAVLVQLRAVPPRNVSLEVLLMALGATSSLAMHLEARVSQVLSGTIALVGPVTIDELKVGFDDGVVMRYSITEQDQRPEVPSVRSAAPVPARPTTPPHGPIEGKSRTSSRSPTPERKRLVATTALSDFKAQLLTKAPSLAAAWRFILDPTASGAVAITDFVRAAREVGFSGDKAEAWRQLTGTVNEKVSLANWDFRTASDLGRFAEAVEHVYGSIGEAIHDSGLWSRKMRRKEFSAAMLQRRLAKKSDCEDLFDMLSDCHSLRRLATHNAQAAVTKDAFLWLGRMAAALPRPGRRSRPGAPTDGTDLSPKDSFCSADEEADDNRPSQGGLSIGAVKESVFESLHESGKGWHERRNKNHAATRPSSQRVATAEPTASQQESSSRLYGDAFRRQQTSEADRRAAIAAEDVLRYGSRQRPPSRDAQVQHRLVQPRPQWHPPEPEQGEAVAHEPQLGSQASKRLFSHGAKREQKLQKAREQAEKEAELARLAMLGGEAKARRRLISPKQNARLYQEQLELLQRQKDMHHQERERKEEVESKLLPKDPLYKLDRRVLAEKHDLHRKRMASLEQAQLRKQMQEEAQLKEQSIHRNVDPRSGSRGVSMRLYGSYGRHVPTPSPTRESRATVSTDKRCNNGGAHPAARPASSPGRSQKSEPKVPARLASSPGRSQKSEPKVMPHTPPRDGPLRQSRNLRKAFAAEQAVPLSPSSRAVPAPSGLLGGTSASRTRLADSSFSAQVARAAQATAEAEAAAELARHAAAIADARAQALRTLPRLAAPRRCVSAME